ncbi:phosphomannomutase CpsG [Psychrobacter sp. I-STPA6b]|uniref:phosphomannomutase CpsG n=1 Tax=Psychrobacter sp. I-STPA6b TaxID=2585718 RepID=UPI001D0C062C|nr:phosphomannomutase CpsG [Psychrobacter sp. I-STPA6b]
MNKEKLTHLPITSFKAYDIRGELGVNLDDAIAYRIGRAFAQILRQQRESSNSTNSDEMAHLNHTIVIGCDIRDSSESLKRATIEGIIDAGLDVIDLGMTGTEEVYFATSHYQAMGGIEVTASHNPINYNGLKLVRENSKPISADTGLADIQALAESGDFEEVAQKGQLSLQIVKTAYIDHLMSFIDLNNLTFAPDKPLKLVINSGNGSAGPVIDEIEARFQQANAAIEIIKVHHEPDGSFPNGIPNPMIVANRTATTEAVLAHQADMGIAFDGDFDRCFLFDETGAFIEGSYIVGMLAQAFLQRHPQASIVYDPRVIYNTEAIIDEFAGQAVLSKSGHSFIKQVMRHSGAVYGGEMSAHHYFKDFFYCDSGMIPWLLTIELLSSTGKKLSELVNERILAYPSSGEMNFRLTDVQSDEIINKIAHQYQHANPNKSTLDGLSLDFGEWRFNLRASNTEPLIRLNIETKGNEALLADKITEIQEWLEGQGAVLA